MNDVADLITALIKQENECSLHWHGEPGGIVLHFSRIMNARHLLAVEISDIENGKTELAFQIMQKQLITILFLQLKKIYHLLSEKHYAKGRTNEFPFGKYEMLTKLMREYLPAVVSE
ncbi:hypothetical protein ACQKLP_14240 [Chitinophaga sp. NPDC101104]|uniref:hypothetical protein n=1 Tax=Chitinophaga sp. NPDC101104 TaxID=3390561 RepID=UPI003D0123A2